MVRSGGWGEGSYLLQQLGGDIGPEELAGACGVAVAVRQVTLSCVVSAPGLRDSTATRHAQRGAGDAAVHARP
jgi:hypothetical protein